MDHETEEQLPFDIRNEESGKILSEQDEIKDFELLERMKAINDMATNDTKTRDMSLMKKDIVKIKQISSSTLASLRDKRTAINDLIAEMDIYGNNLKITANQERMKKSIGNISVEIKILNEQLKVLEAIYTKTTFLFAELTN